MGGKERVMDDLISRQAAIDAVKKNTFRLTFAEEQNCEGHVAWSAEAVYSDVMEGALLELPSSQPEPIRININETIKVKLTDLGKEIYYHQYDRINEFAGRKICEPKFPKEDENGYTEFQLWCFIKLYGGHIGVTLPNVIKPNEIVYER